jgi:hypothetical protein
MRLHFPVKAILILILISINNESFAQKSDTTKNVNHFGATVLVTNKGISTIPNLTLGKPAAILSMSVGRKLTFEPEFRIALEGKPWMVILWWRYEFLNNDRFLIKAGANPTAIFKTITDTINGVPGEVMIATRTLTADFYAGYSVARNIRLGPYYMYIYGVEKDAIRNTHFIALRCSFTNIKLTDQLYMRINPQVYYLRMADDDGFYVNASLSLAKRNFPFSISALISRAIQTDIKTGELFLWNVGLVYSFNKEYIER